MKNSGAPPPYEEVAEEPPPPYEDLTTTDDFVPTTDTTVPIVQNSNVSVANTAQPNVNAPNRHPAVVPHPQQGGGGTFPLPGNTKSQQLMQPLQQVINNHVQTQYPGPPSNIIVENNQDFISEDDKMGKFGPKGANLYVKNIPRFWTKDDLGSMFGFFGFITSHHVLRKLKARMNEGAGFVCYSSYEDAEDAIKFMHARVVGRGDDRRQISVSVKEGEEEFCPESLQVLNERVKEEMRQAERNRMPLPPNNAPPSDKNPWVPAPGFSIDQELPLQIHTAADSPTNTCPPQHKNDLPAPHPPQSTLPVETPQRQSHPQGRGGSFNRRTPPPQSGARQQPWRSRNQQEQQPNGGRGRQGGGGGVPHHQPRSAGMSARGGFGSSATCGLPLPPHALPNGPSQAFAPPPPPRSTPSPDFCYYCSVPRAQCGHPPGLVRA
uniref:RRM domain-containing protein n=1 Tax=Chromera velia CCMP2878 TaxID=1169474 RepID=A0A0G4FUX1_9ALVE|eukprot:Cvel_3769.t1-p1 / transcript=Cvel_3769.t1 / gene=Cvel_3769 / organism=Chromera_velia_CCMP2878 / gene_product=Polyadenylate-binding protein, cytoplasmic and, putative / transcript_product=Polyadenylate-binding protein, cytoplasmic and, putative / location=Cvel_scaffold158:22944-25086(-) / protein_length=434 / sequence_SO=supercontig / SO=protein_coding / is_pseudo=false